MQLFSTLQPVNVVTNLVAGPDEFADLVTVYCPSCERLGCSSFDSLVLLPIHDANGRLLAEVRNGITPRPRFFAGVFALDPFRRHSDILKALEIVGCPGIVNFPSVTGIDGEMRASLEDFGFGVKTEIELLRRAVAHGFSALALVDGFAMAQEAVAVGVSGLVAARHTKESVLVDLPELARETALGLFRLPDAVGGIEQVLGS
ncbi:phosphoenolpyruvate hydrolase family protein [Bradyrhizobium sp. DASA03005]|uniref:phosphoenolpyruvate hydrolase family protein n=1 Tax=Bradyrhizobium sp. SPXBL-02 TaxID=3395912 RepID=UPI003F723803